MAPKFGTSGLRGLVTELTPDLVSDYIRAFLHACPTGTGLFIGCDLRPSSPYLAQVVIAAARADGIAVTDCGATPTPALALAAMGAGAAAVMVTGSHIPADRNGLKFYVPNGEITKAHECSIMRALGRPARGGAGALAVNTSAGTEWVQRYIAAFDPDALAGRRIGVWSHSAVSRDLLLEIFAELGADVIEVGRSDTFIPVDTEAVPDWARQMIAAWVAEYQLDALVSTDGDGDRPLVADETGRVMPGDILGQITARLVGAEVVVTPVTSNSGAEASGRFARVVRTKVGSPFVIAAMESEVGDVVGYEANGGFLLGFDAKLTGALPRLMTRDSMLPLVAVLTEARRLGSLSALVSGEPAFHTAADRIQDVPTERSTAFIHDLSASDTARVALLARLGEEPAGVDRTDGLRIACVSGNTIHLRASGNAPEMRVYVEANALGEAQSLLERSLQLVSKELTTTNRH